jgi:hypothetical protein
MTSRSSSASSGGARGLSGASPCAAPTAARPSPSRSRSTRAASLERAHAEQRALRPELDLGVAGTRSGASGLKCLHAHAAFALARSGYELGERILAEVEPRWPPDGCCTG